MVSWMQLGVAWGLTLTLTVIVAAIMRRPLFAVLQYVCGSDVGARFWSTYTSVMIVTGPLFLVSLGGFGLDNLADFVRRTMVLTSFGIIMTVTIMGIAVSTTTQRPPRDGGS